MPHNAQPVWLAVHWKTGLALLLAAQLMRTVLLAMYLMEDSVAPHVQQPMFFITLSKLVFILPNAVKNLRFAHLVSLMMVLAANLVASKIAQLASLILNKMLLSVIGVRRDSQ